MVTAAESSNEPRQPSRLEKKKNTCGSFSKDDLGTDAAGFPEISIFMRSTQPAPIPATTPSSCSRPISTADKPRI